MRKKVRVAIVTGAGHGIGAACARAWRLKVGRQSAPTLMKAGCNKPRTTFSGQAVLCDVSKEADVRRLVDETVKTFGRIDAIVSNAGIMQRKPLGDTSSMTGIRVIDHELDGGISLGEIRRGSFTKG